MGATQLKSFDDLMDNVQRERLESIGLLAAGMAHELGNPLGVIRGRAEILMHSLPPESVRNLQIILSAVDRMVGLIENLQQFYRGFQSPACQLQNITPIINQVRQLIQGIAQVEQITVGNEASVPIMAVCDGFRLQQVLMCLVTNALEAIARAKAKDLHVQHELSINAKDIGEVVEIRVTDTGVGIHQDELPCIFQPFYTTKQVGAGKGIGLTLAKFWLQQMGADIRVDSQHQGGTCFVITLRKQL